MAVKYLIAIVLVVSAVLLVMLAGTDTISGQGTGPQPDPVYTEEDVQAWTVALLDHIEAQITNQITEASQDVFAHYYESIGDRYPDMYLALDRLEALLAEVPAGAGGVIAVSADSPVKIGGERGNAVTPSVGCPANLTPLLATTVLLPAPDTDVDVLTVDLGGGTYLGIGEQDGLPAGTPYQVRLTVLCQ